MKIIEPIARKLQNMPIDFRILALTTAIILIVYSITACIITLKLIINKEKH